ncbi:MAG: Shikimate dehydrogenase (NADP(+)) [Verrucomicrobia subdivision 3 bacterium]|nr:Shikimate dehydrogenase (NADP(+)) [Limisphaerales bacterium]MCS1412486.1 Shikimate dehydrogenase (NADP(+)) [Limisphaerales bacterium]
MAALKLAAGGVNRLFVVNRTVGKAEALKVEIEARFSGCRVTLGYPSERVDTLLNGTFLGLKVADPLPIDRKQFSLSQAAAYDMIYQPAETLLLHEAQDTGCQWFGNAGLPRGEDARDLSRA